MTIHKEGIPTIIITLIFLSLLNGSVYRLSENGLIESAVLVISVVFFLIILQFFRKPYRKVTPISNNQILAPADGKVVVIEDAIESEYFEDERLMISIFMSPINVHSNHHPVSGKVVYSKYHPGKYLVAWHPKSSTENERHTLVYDTGKHKVLIRQIAGALARRIVNYMSPNEEVVAGEECGFIKFGSRVDIFLPVGTEYKVQIGQHVRSRRDIIAEVK